MALNLMMNEGRYPIDLQQLSVSCVRKENLTLRSKHEVVVDFLSSKDFSRPPFFQIDNNMSKASPVPFT